MSLTVHRSHIPSTHLSSLLLFFLSYISSPLSLSPSASLLFFIDPYASCLVLFCCGLCCTFQSLLSPLLFLIVSSPGTGQQINVSCSTWSVFKEQNRQNPVNPGEVHLVWVHTDKIPLPGSSLFTQTICHCQLVVNVQAGSLTICSKSTSDKIVHPLETVSQGPSWDNLATPDQTCLRMGFGFTDLKLKELERKYHSLFCSPN